MHSTLESHVGTLVTAFPDDLGSAHKGPFVCELAVDTVGDSLADLLSVSQTEEGRSALLSINAPEKLAVPVWRVCRWWCDEAGGSVGSAKSSTDGEQDEQTADDSKDAQSSAGADGSDTCQGIDEVQFQLTIRLLRLLRNMCAAGAECQDAFEDKGLHMSVARLAQHLGGKSSKETEVTKLLTAALQFLGNFGVNNAKTAEALWVCLMPKMAFQLASSGHLAAHPPLCMALLTAVRTSGDRRAKLCHGEGAGIMNVLLCRAAQPPASTEGETESLQKTWKGACTWPGGGGEWLGFLLGALCLQDSLLPALFHSLRRGGGGGASGAEGPVAELEDDEEQDVGSRWTFGQAALLELLANVLAQHHKNLCPPICLPSASFVLLQVQCAAGEAALRANEPSPGGERRKPPEDPAQAVEAVVAGGLSVLQTLTSLGHVGADAATWVWIDETVVPQIAHLVRALGPPLPPGYSQKPAGSGIPRVDYGIPSHQPPTVKEEYAVPLQSLYAAYRRDLVAILCNASSGRSERVAPERAGGGGLLEALLEHCTGDDHCPFVREWAVLGINNLTEGNSVIQQEISDLEFVKVLDDPAMKAKGLHTEMDPTTGRPQIVRHA